MSATNIVLLAEDEATDAFFLQRAFQRAQIPNRLVAVKDGQGVVDYLTAQGEFADRTANPLPTLLILDLKMPRMSGFDVLRWLTGQPDFTHLPAIVLTSSSDPEDMAKARQLGARDYLVKPFGIEKLAELVQILRERWL